MSQHPFDWPNGQPVSLRASIFKKLALAAEVGAQVGRVSWQYTALRDGQPVTFTTAQLRSFYPNETEHPSLPPELGIAGAWTLTGDDTLTPAV